MLGISDAVIYGVKSGLKLVKETRQIFIDQAISRDLILPLPNDLFDDSNKTSAHRFFQTPKGKELLVEHANLKEIFDKIRNNESLSDVEEQMYINASLKFKQLNALGDQLKSRERRKAIRELRASGFNTDSLKSLATVQQFAHIHNRENPSAFQRVLGSLIEIGVDSFSKFPGILDTTSASGRALSGFLNAIDDLNFKSERVDTLARSLFISAVETIGENTELLGADEKTELLIKSVSSGLIRDMNIRIENDPSGQQHVEKWGNLVLRSVLGNVGEAILTNPKSIGIDGAAQQALISSVGTSIFGAILDEDKVNLRPLFSKQGLDQVVRASLHTVAEFPELLGVKGEGIRNIIMQIGQGLAENERVLGRDMLPEAARLIIEKTAQNAEFLWPAGFNDSTGKHLLVTASVSFLSQFASIPESGATWRPVFSKNQLTGLLEVILEETIQNPMWVDEKLNVDDQTIIGQATRITLDILQDVPADQLTLETGSKILKAVIHAVSIRLDFLDILPEIGERVPGIAAALKRIVGALISKELDPKVLWIMARGEVAGTIVSTALDVLTKVGISEETINLVLSVIEKAKESIKNGQRWDLKEVLDNLKNIAIKPTI